MKWIYRGPFKAVTIPALGVTAERGKSVDLPDTVVLGDDWEQAKASKSNTDPKPQKRASAKEK